MANQSSVHFDALLATTRFGWGAAPGQLETLGSGARNWIESQLFIMPRLDTAGAEGIREAFLLQEEYQSKAKTMPEQNNGAANRIRLLARQAVTDRIKLAAATDQPFVDRLVAFWSNHFAISGKSRILKLLAPIYEADAIRPHVLGSFSQMLLAVVRHPAMLLYLDNDKSIGPNSKAGKRRGAGLNENLAREILELHTLGVNGGYDQADVTAFAKALTGWSVNHSGDKADLGGFVFNDNRHEPGSHSVLGKTYDQAESDQAISILNDISRHPSTARTLAFKLARHFVSDDPPNDLVASLAKTFIETDGNLLEVSRALVRSEAAWRAARQRFLPPFAFVAALERALPGILPPARPIHALQQMGAPLWEPPSPEGYPDESGAWLGPEALKIRLNLAAQAAQLANVGNNALEFADNLFASALSAETRQTVSRAESATQGLTLLFMAPEFLRR